MGIISEIIRRLIGSEIDTSIALVKIEAAIVSLNIVRGTRRVAILACLLVFCAILFACGFLLVPIALCLFMPWAPETKAIVLAGFGAAYILLPLIAAMVLMSERRWMKASKADQLVKEALKK
jgi:hypothetical protein